MHVRPCEACVVEALRRGGGKTPKQLASGGGGAPMSAAAGSGSYVVEEVDAAGETKELLPGTPAAPGLTIVTSQPASDGAAPGPVEAWQWPRDDKARAEMEDLFSMIDRCVAHAFAAASSRRAGSSFC